MGYMYSNFNGLCLNNSNRLYHTILLIMFNSASKSEADSQVVSIEIVYIGSAVALLM